MKAYECSGRNERRRRRHYASEEICTPECSISARSYDGRQAHRMQETEYVVLGGSVKKRRRETICFRSSLDFLFIQDMQNVATEHGALWTLATERGNCNARLSSFFPVWVQKRGPLARFSSLTRRPCLGRPDGRCFPLAMFYVCTSYFPCRNALF